MTNEEILKLAKAEWSAGDLYIGPDLQAIERIYRAAFNAGLEAAAKVCDTKAEFMAMMGGSADPDVLAEQIRALKSDQA